MVLSGDNSKVTSEVNRLLAELPASVHALTGVDLSKVCACLAAVGLPGQPIGLARQSGPGSWSQGLMACPILADTPDQEGHRCAGVRLLQAHSLQQPPSPPSSTRFNPTEQRECY